MKKGTHIRIDPPRIKEIEGIPIIYFGTGRYVVGSKAFGAEWDSNSTLVELTRKEHSQTLSQSDFNYIEPWSRIRRCTLADNGDRNHYHYETGYAEDGTDGQVVVEIPKLWYNMFVSSTGEISWAISPEEIPFFSLHPDHIRNSVEKDYIYLGAFQASFYDTSGSTYADYYVGSGNPNSDDDGDADGSPTGTTPDTTADTGDVLASVAGHYPLTKLDIVDFRTLAHNRGSGWEQVDFLTQRLVNLLFTIEFASLDGQSALGQGVVGKTWSSTYKAELTGQATYGSDNPNYGITTDGLHSMCYRGIENWWGNVWQWCDGINIKADWNPWIADHGFESDKFESPYWDTGLTLPDTNGYISDIYTSPDWAFLPKAQTGSSSEYFCDYYYEATGNRVLRFGGAWTYGGGAGPWAWVGSISSSDASVTLGGRLMFIP